MQRARRGAVLFEALVALVVVATAGSALAQLANESLYAVHRAAVADEESRAASAFLGAVALWSADELDQRLGARQQGPWYLTVERREDALYIVTLRDSTRQRELLATALYRPNRFSHGR